MFQASDWVSRGCKECLLLRGDEGGVGVVDKTPAGTENGGSDTAEEASLGV